MPLQWAIPGESDLQGKYYDWPVGHRDRRARLPDTRNQRQHDGGRHRYVDLQLCPRARNTAYHDDRAAYGHPTKRGAATCPRSSRESQSVPVATFKFIVDMLPEMLIYAVIAGETGLGHILPRFGTAWPWRELGSAHSIGDAHGERWWWSFVFKFGDEFSLAVELRNEYITSCQEGFQGQSPCQRLRQCYALPGRPLQVI